MSCHKAKDTHANTHTHANVNKPHRPDQMCHERGWLSEDPLCSKLWYCVHNVCSPCLIWRKKNCLNVLKRTFLFFFYFLSMFYSCRFLSTCSVNVLWCCITWLLCCHGVAVFVPMLKLTGLRSKKKKRWKCTDKMLQKNKNVLLTPKSRRCRSAVLRVQSVLPVLLIYSQTSFVSARGL